jgi:hypothetical protein
VPLRYVPRDDFYNPDYAADQPKNLHDDWELYHHRGGRNRSPSRDFYYQDIPPLGDTATWLLTKYPTVFLVTTLHLASMYAIEDERSSVWSAKQTR